jgi:short-subunit dehydrogenase
MPGDASATATRPVVLITGASAGIGASLARELVRRRKAGALVLTARRVDRLERLADELRARQHDLEVVTIAADLADPATPKRLIAETTSRFGGLDVLINNAGLGLPTQFADAEPDQLARQIAVNFTAPLMLSRLSLPSLIERGGMLINIGSAITCVANSALGAYGATKAGLAYWNDALRRELWLTGVRVCLVEPGPIKTEFMDALSSLVPAGGRPDPILDNAAPWMTADVGELARRVVGLLDHPRRRLSVLRRFVWFFRILGAAASICPPLGDRVVVVLSRKPAAPGGPTASATHSAEHSS